MTTEDSDRHSSVSLRESVSIPKRLGKSPLLENLFEVRFENEQPSELLAGILYSQLRGDYPRAAALPLSEIPAEFRRRNKELRYQVTHRFSGDDASVAIGGSVAAVSVTRYAGWSDFKPRIEGLIAALKTTGMGRIERFSMRAINLFADGEWPQKGLELLDVDLRIGGQRPQPAGMHLRAEVRQDGFLSILQIAPQSSAKGPGIREGSGLLVDVDTIRDAPGTMEKADRSELLDAAHDAAKRVFFSLLTKSTLAACRPEY